MFTESLQTVEAIDAAMREADRIKREFRDKEKATREAEKRERLHCLEKRETELREAFARLIEREGVPWLMAFELGYNPWAGEVRVSIPKHGSQVAYFVYRDYVGWIPRGDVPGEEFGTWGTHYSRTLAGELLWREIRDE